MARSTKKTADYELVEPDASAMMESLRAFGYSTPAAVADLIDNSITAGARNVWIEFHWNGRDSHFAILDDGGGMNEEVLVGAMRAGSRSPLEERTAADLGRFGLGLKTASFSQCRQLTVASKAKGHPQATRRWDLDYVREHRQWRLLKTPAAESVGRLDALTGMAHGTLVLWEKMDRVVPGDSVQSEADHARFRHLIDVVEEHLGMVFHRFLGTAFRVFVNGRQPRHQVRPWDPFLPTHDATQQLPVESVPTPAGVVTVRPYVLPHKDRLGDKLHEAAAGPAGWNAQQGFYVYRNERLLVAGDWLGLGYTKEEHYKLARIQIDLPNTMDSEWDIDVKKSRARPPGTIRDRLKVVADLTRRRAVEVYRHRGRYGARNAPGPEAFAWVPGRRKDRMIYAVNRDHPLAAAVLAAAGDNRPAVEALLRLLEETVPVRQIWLDAAQVPDGHARPFEEVADKDVKQVMTQVYDALRRGGHSPAAAKERVGTMDAFAAHPHLLATLAD
jgi:Histidine kinase-, DNA gyrase B-, and HSP90-like ATPase